MTDLAELPRRFGNPDPDLVSKLPRVTCRECSKSRTGECDRHKKTKCRECGAFISSQHIHLDFVGHADLTLQLIEADPAWWWEPLVVDPDTGGPKIVERDGFLVMWGRLHLLGTQTVEVGSCPADKGDADKELVGDFLRRAAMRRGFATKLWSKTDREAGLNGASNGQQAKVESKTVKAKPEPEPEPKSMYLPSDGAMDLFCDVHQVGFPDNTPDIHEYIARWPEWKWKLASYDQQGLEAAPWKELLAGSGIKRVEMEQAAKALANKLGLPEPDRLDDVHGQLILELRRAVLADELGTF